MNTHQPVAVFASFRPRPERREHLHALLTQMLAATRQEAGNWTYRLFSSDADGAGTFHLFEEYASPQALDAHRDADYYKEYRAALPDLLEEPVRVLVLEESDVSRT